MAADGGAVTRQVIVLNHFAAPLNSPGGTRHVELFGRLSGWRSRVIAANRDLLGGERVRPSPPLETVWVAPYSGNGPARILSWVSYAVTAFVRAVRARPLDLVYGSSPHLLAALAGLVVARLRRVPFVLEIRDVWPKVLVDMGAMSADSAVYRVLHRLEAFLYRRAERIVILAEGVRDHLLSHGVEAERIVFIPNAADPADFEPTAPRADLRRRYGFDGIVAVYAGAHGPANGLDLLLDAAAQVGRQHPELELVLVGDGAVKGDLVARSRRERIGNVRFLDPVPKAEIRNVLAAADIGVHCLADVDLFRSGVSPNKLFDYMAAGLPVVTNTPGETGQFVIGSGGGFAVGPEGLGEALSTLCEMADDDRHALGAQGRQYIDDNRSRRQMAARLEQMLNEVVA